MFVLSYFLIGLVIFFVNFNVGDKSFQESNVPLFKGEFTAFSVEWYRLVGSTLVFTMIILIASTHVFNISYAFIMGSVLRWYDRGFSLNDEHKTRKLIQEEYEDINLGSEFETEYKFSSILLVMGVTFLYS